MSVLGVWPTTFESELPVHVRASFLGVANGLLTTPFHLLCLGPLSE